VGSSAAAHAARTIAPIAEPFNPSSASLTVSVCAVRGWPNESPTTHSSLS